jgi:hypothetical protein
VTALGIDAKPRALNRYSAALRKWQSFNKLGGFWSGAVNLTQICMNTYPVLGAKYTTAGIGEGMTPKGFRTWQKKLVELGVDEVEIFMPFTAEGNLMMPGTIKSAVKNQKHLDVVHRSFLFLFNGAEKVNRMTTAVGAFKKYMAENAGSGVPRHLMERRAAAYANRAVMRTQFNYRMGNMPEVLRGPVGATIGQFKSFVINELEFIAGLSGKELARFGSAISALGGISLLFNMPGGDVVSNASLLWSDQSLEERVKLSVGEGTPQDTPADKARYHASKFMAFGVPGMLFDVDMSDYIGVGNLRDVTRSLLGPSVSDAKMLGDYFQNAAVDLVGIGRIRQETKTKLYRTIAPSAVERAVRGYEVAASGGEVRDQVRGKLIYQADRAYSEGLRETPGYVAAQLAIGAPPIRLQQEYAMQALQRRVRERYINQHGDYAKRAASAMRERRMDEVAKIKQEALANGILLKDDAIKYQYEELTTISQSRLLKRTPVQRRERIARAMQNMGVPPAEMMEFQKLRRSDPTQWQGLLGQPQITPAQ